MAEFTYDYAVIRVVPRVERGEQINVGVILSCTDSDVVECRIALDPARGVIVANYNDMPNYVRLVPRAEANERGWAPRDQARGNIGTATNPRGNHAHGL